MNLYRVKFTGFLTPESKVGYSSEEYVIARSVMAASEAMVAHLKELGYQRVEFRNIIQLHCLDGEKKGA